MATIRITLPEDFDAKYDRYRNKFNERKMPEPFLIDRLAGERKDLLLINDERDYQHELDKWKPLKVIVDAIYKELSPFMEKNQAVKIAILKLEVSDNVASSVLMMLVYERICRWKLPSSAAVISTVPVKEYLSGDGIIVPSYEKFRDFRKEVHDFYHFMVSHQKEKFAPKSPVRINADSNAARSSQEKAIRRLLEEGEKDDALQKKISDTIEEKLEAKRITPSGSIPIIDYNPVTGIGFVDARKFRFKDGQPEYKVFSQLYTRIGKKLERHDVLIAAGFYKDYESPDPARKTNETSFINDIAKAIREKTRLDTEQLVNNAGNLTLVATKLSKSTPK